MGDYFFRILKQRFGVEPTRPTIKGKKVPHLSGLCLVDPVDDQQAAFRARMMEALGRRAQAGQAE